MHGRMSAKRALKFDNYDTKKKLGSLAQPENQSSVPELSYKTESVPYFEFILYEVWKNTNILSVLSEEDLNVVINFWKLEHQVKKLWEHKLTHNSFSTQTISGPFEGLTQTLVQ
jgi:hypothetical protein